MRRLQLRYAESEYFKVVCPTSRQQRVGSGLSVRYLIRFSPDIKKVVTLTLLRLYATIALSANVVCYLSLPLFYI